jgi:hypothetical protein
MRVPLIWLWRLLLCGFAVAYLAIDSLQLWIPPLLPFVAALLVEAQFFVSGLRPRERGAVDRGPQERDLADFGWTGEEDDDEVAPPLPARRRRRLRPRLVQVALVLACLSGLFLIDRSRASWQKLPAHERVSTLARLDRAAARIAGHPARVMCDTSGRRVGYVQDTDGLAEVGGRRLWLTPGICYRLAKARDVTPSTEAATGHAIAVLAHEAWHLHGETSEARANCFAYQSGVRVGRDLGLSADTARRLMRRQLADNPADFADARAYVVPAGCRHGGELDLGLDGTHFP